jgi:hypothetical protein
MGRRAAVRVLGGALLLAGLFGGCDEKPVRGGIACSADAECAHDQICNPSGACADLIAPKHGVPCKDDGDCPAEAAFCDHGSGMCFDNVTAVCMPGTACITGAVCKGGVCVRP